MNFHNFKLLIAFRFISPLSSSLLPGQSAYFIEIGTKINDLVLKRFSAQRS